MKILICDDDISIVQTVKANIVAFAKKHKIDFVIDTCTSSETVYKSEACYDMAFIDIEMPHIDGLTLISRLKEINDNIIVFVITSYECYLDSAMDLDVFRYISKPIDIHRLSRSLEIALKRFRESTQRITLEYYDEYYSIFTKDILFITTENSRAVVVTKQRKYHTNKRMSYWRVKLKEIEYFAQPHHSYLVNLRYVSEFNKTELSLVCDNQKYKIPISQRGYSNFKKSYFSYMGT